MNGNKRGEMFKNKDATHVHMIKSWNLATLLGNVTYVTIAVGLDATDDVWSAAMKYIYRKCLDC